MNVSHVYTDNDSNKYLGFICFQYKNNHIFVLIVPIVAVVLVMYDELFANSEALSSIVLVELCINQKYLLFFICTHGSNFQCTEGQILFLFEKTTHATDA